MWPASDIGTNHTGDHTGQQSEPSDLDLLRTDRHRHDAGRGQEHPSIHQCSPRNRPIPETLLRPMKARSWREAKPEAGPGTYTSEPVSDTLKWAAPLRRRRKTGSPFRCVPGATHVPGREARCARHRRRGGANIWIYDLSKESSIRQLTFGGRNRFPVWTSDGQRVAFQSDREGDAAIFWQHADGTDTAQRLTRADRGVSHIPESWSRTEDRFLFSTSASSNLSLWTFSVPDSKAEPFGETVSAFPLHAVFSPDSRWVAYAQFTSRNTGVFVEPFPRTGAKYRIAATGIHPLWSPTGKELFYSTGGFSW